MVTNLNVGDSYSITPSGSAHGTKGIPPWMSWNGGTVSGTAKLPSGFRRITSAEMTLGTSVSILDKSVDVAPISLPADATSSWRVAIYASNGAYIIANGLTGISTIGTPQVRLSRSAPSRAIVRFPLGRGADNVLGSLTGWSDGIARPISRGMELTVEFRDADGGSLVPVFRGRIYQIESGESIKVTAYDRLMDLYQTTGQYLSHAGQSQGAKSTSRSTSGSDYVYQMGTTIGVVTGIDAINSLNINALANMTTALDGDNSNRIIIHGLPTAGGITPAAGDTITKLHTKITAHLSGAAVGTGAKSLMGMLTAYVYIFEKQGSSFVLKGQGNNLTFVSYTTSGWGTVNEDYDRSISVTLSTPVTITDPNNTYIGVRANASVMSTTGSISGNFDNLGADKSSTRYTTSGVPYYISTDNGSTWSSYTQSDKPEVGITFMHTGSSIAPNLATVSGTTVIIAQANIPAGPSDTYLSTEDAGAGILVDYYESNKAPLAEIVRELLESAGLFAEIGSSADLGLVTLYTVVTTDYLTALHDIIEARGYGLKDNVLDAGHISLLPEHTVTEASIKEYTTDPSGAGEKIIESHDLTVHWMAEKATVAYIAENATASGLPLALETDDALMSDSLTETLQVPMSGIVVDNTLGTHDMMANAAGGAIRKLHTNAIEGSITLTGYRPSLWDFIGSGVGGYPITLDVPEYGAQGVVIPTEIILADGVTQVQLNNIRTQDRNGVAQSMGLVEGSVSNDATLLPKTVYIFGRADGYNQIPLGGELVSLDGVSLVRADGTYFTQNVANYLKTATDTAGYLHLLAVFPEAAGTYTSLSPISAVVVDITTDGGSQKISAVVEPKYILDNQHIHVDVRLRNP